MAGLRSREEQIWRLKDTLSPKFQAMRSEWMVNTGISKGILSSPWLASQIKFALHIINVM